MGNLLEKNICGEDYTYDYDTCLLPPKAQIYYGLSNLGHFPNNQVIIYKDLLIDSLGRLNDNEMPFPEIAKVIRKKWLS